jgi:hypothetical protein
VGIGANGGGTLHTLIGPTPRRAKIIGGSSNSFYITNYESILNRGFRDAVAGSDIALFIVDECTAFKHFNTRRSKYFRLMGANKIVWGLTATPMPNGPMNAYGVARAIQQDYTESMTRFRMRTHTKQGQWEWIPKKSAVADAYEVLQPSIRIPRDACYAVPAETTETRIVAVSDDAKRLYRQLRKDAYAQLQSGAHITVAHEAALRNKLLQVSGGAVYTSAGTAVLNAGGRATELVDLLQQYDDKFIIYVPFRSQLELVVGICKGEGYSVAAIHGDTSLKERTKLIDLYQRTAHPRIIVADPRVLSHGVELTRAGVVVWWLPIDSAEYYEQALARPIGRDKTEGFLNVQLCGTKLEQKIYQRLEARQSLQGVLLDAISGEFGE